MGLLFSLPLPVILIYFVAAIAMAVHAVRNGHELYWVFIIFIIPILGAVVYFLAIVLPELQASNATRKIAEKASAALDPGRAYREAKAALAESETVANMKRVADLALDMGRADEAEALYARALTGVYAEDGNLLRGHARALCEMGQFARALEQLKIADAERKNVAMSAETALLFARIHEGLGDLDIADKHFRDAITRLPGLEALARYRLFLLRTQRRADADQIAEELQARFARTPKHMQPVEKRWRDLA